MEESIKRVKRDLKYFPISKLNSYKEIEKEIYLPASSNKQISTIYKAYKKDVNKYRNYYFSLLILLTKQYNLGLEDIMKLLNKKDDQIYKILREKKITLPPKYSKISSQLRCYISKNKKIKNFLDVGCMDGFKTFNTGICLGLKPKNIYCLNLEDDNDYKKNNRVNFRTYKENQKFPFEDNYFSIVNFDMVLHHIMTEEGLEFVLKETYRVLRKGGLLLIREHDTRTGFDKMLCDIQHQYFNYQEGIYTSWLELNYKITNCGFILRKHVTDTSYNNQILNATRTYYNLYEKN